MNFDQALYTFISCRAPKQHSRGISVPLNVPNYVHDCHAHRIAINKTNCAKLGFTLTHGYLVN